MCVGHKIAWALVIIGAVNWGLIGFFEYDLVHAVVGTAPTVERVIYALVGLSGIFMLFMKQCTMCKKG
jgi:uncharacterized membrane protein YuzA (DUF378 family)